MTAVLKREPEIISMYLQKETALVNIPVPKIRNWHLPRLFDMKIWERYMCENRELER